MTIAAANARVRVLRTRSSVWLEPGPLAPDPYLFGPSPPLTEGTKHLNAQLAQPLGPPASPTEIPQVRVPDPPPQVSHGQGGISRHTWALVVKSGRTCPLNSGNPAQVQGFPCWWMVVRDRIELSTFRFSGGRSYRLSYLTWLVSGDSQWTPRGPDGI